jgi:hypothetical protein
MDAWRHFLFKKTFFKEQEEEQQQMAAYSVLYLL